jgi:uncharacterized caspase-like protein
MGDRYALIVASSEYEDRILSQLTAPAQDAAALATVLEDPAIAAFQVTIVRNKPSHQVNQEIETFFADRQREDLLLAYFSGHGIKDDEGKLYFASPSFDSRLLL